MRFGEMPSMEAQPQQSKKPEEKEKEPEAIEELEDIRDVLSEDGKKESGGIEESGGEDVSESGDFEIAENDLETQSVSSENLVVEEEDKNIGENGVEKITEEQGGKNVNEVATDLEALPKEEKEKIKKGLENIGFFMEKAKCDFLNKKLEECSEFIGKDRTTGRFLKVAAENYAENAKKAQKNIEMMDKAEGRGKILTLMNVGAIAKNIMWPARLAMGALPMRGLMAAGAYFAKGCEVAKDVRLRNEEVIEKQKIQESEEAAEVAWRMYEMAQEKADEGKVSSEDLDEAFQKNIPWDVLRRVENNKNAKEENTKENNEEKRTGFTSKVAEIFAEKYIKFSATRMDKKMQKIEGSEKLSREEKRNEMMALLSKYSKQLKFVDETVSSTGKIDLLAVSARAGELGGKAMMAVSAAELLKTVWDKLPDFVEEAEGSEIKIGGKAAKNFMQKKMEEGIPASAVVPKSAEQFLENLSTLYPNLENVPASSFFTSLEDNSPEKGIFLRIATKIGMPKMNENLSEYLQKATNISPNDLERLAKLAKI